MAPSNGNRVKYLIKPNLLGTNGWLALREDLLLQGEGPTEAARGLARRFSAIEVWFSDLDDFDSRSPAKRVAMKALGTRHLDPAYLKWAFGTIVSFLRDGRWRTEISGWKRYYETFLKQDRTTDWLKQEAFESLEAFFTPQRIVLLLYPGVREFYASFGARKYLVTRNIERIAYRYSKVLPYTEYYYEVCDKAAVVEAFMALYPEVRFYGSGGDSPEDAAVAELLDYYWRKGRIEKPLCLFKAHSPRALDPSFNIYVGKNRTGLVEILKSPRAVRGTLPILPLSVPSAP
jgi:hypothetical protein